MAKKKNNDSVKLVSFGLAVFAVGAFFSYGIVMFAGVALFIAGWLPATKDEHDPL